MSWSREFGDDYRPPHELIGMVELGLIKDLSWRHDICPKFGARNLAGEELVIWSDNINPGDREIGGSRYAVCYYGLEEFRTIVETDDIKTAIRLYMENIQW